MSFRSTVEWRSTNNPRLDHWTRPLTFLLPRSQLFAFESLEIQFLSCNPKIPDDERAREQVASPRWLKSLEENPVGEFFRLTLWHVWRLVPENKRPSMSAHEASSGVYFYEETRFSWSLEQKPKIRISDLSTQLRGRELEISHCYLLEIDLWSARKPLNASSKKYNWAASSSDIQSPLFALSAHS